MPSSTVASPPSSGGVVSPAMKLYRDALHTLFQFLDFTTFVRTFQINREWSQAGRTMQTRKDQLEYKGPLGLLIQSPQRHHIARLDVHSCTLDENELFLFRDHMGHLDALNVSFILEQDRLTVWSIRKQVEFYFSDSNLPSDKHWKELYDRQDGWISVAEIASFKKMRALTTDLAILVAALKASTFLKLNEDETKVTRITPLPAVEDLQAIKGHIIHVRNLPADSTCEIEAFFNQPKHNVTVKYVRLCKDRKEKKFNGTAFVEVASESEAKKAAEELHNKIRWDEDDLTSPALLILTREQFWRLKKEKEAAMKTEEIETRSNQPKHNITHTFFPIPSNLSELSISFTLGLGLAWSQSKVRAYLSDCLKQIGAQTTRLVKLAVELPNANCIFDYPEGLQNLSSVTHLTLPSQFHLVQQIDLVKCLPAIRQWVRPARTPLTCVTIHRLMDGSGPTSPHLEAIGPVICVDDAIATQLKRLTNLTELDLSQLAVSDPTTLLPFFPRLSLLELTCTDTVNVHHLSTALSACVSLTSLDLNHKQLTSDHLSSILPHLISLAELSLNTCQGLVSLEFLTQSKKSLTNLHTFSIAHSTQMPIGEYDHLSSISSSLQFLSIVQSTIGTFDPITICRWTPGSMHFSRQEWPRLQKFDCYCS